VRRSWSARSEWREYSGRQRGGACGLETPGYEVKEKKRQVISLMAGGFLLINIDLSLVLSSHLTHFIPSLEF
jgi:hypothetical protein